MAGIYTEITEIVAPSGAAAGETVNIKVTIKNLHSSTMGIMVGGALEYGVTPWPTIDFPTNWDNVDAGSAQAFDGSFSMPYYPPGKEITIHAYSYWYGDDEMWHFDDEKTKIVTTIAPVEYEGTITKKELKYDATAYTIPAEDVPLGEKIRIHIWGRNDTSISQDLGIHWLIYDPDGDLVRDYSDWSYGHGAGNDHEFVTPWLNAIPLNKVGTYTIEVALSMNPDAPVIVDQYIGDLCTVAAVVEEPRFDNLSVTYRRVEA